MSTSLPKPFGTYVLLKSLGSGAMGDVHLARPYDPGRGIPTPVVIKRMHSELGNDEDFVRRFQHEASIAVSVDSDHVAKVYDVGAVDDTLYIAMEFVSGWPLTAVLAEIIKSGQHASIASIVDLVEGGILGLGALHGAKDIETGKPLGVVHRDISPKNLMVGDDGVMRLIDLGLGKSNVQDWKTRTGIVMGSVGYMPPEQVTAETVDHRADLFAMGVVLYELLTLQSFIERAPLPVMLRASLDPPWRPPSSVRPDVPKALDEVVRKSVMPDAEDRYQSADEFLRALRKVVPKTATRGGMAQLVKELYGHTLAERDAEMHSLLSLQLEDDDGPEIERTVVFVQRAGVQPMTADLPPTSVHQGYGSGSATPLDPASSGYQQMYPQRREAAFNAQPTFPIDPGSLTSNDSHFSAVRGRRQVPQWLVFVLGCAAMFVLMLGYNELSNQDTVVTVDGTSQRPQPEIPEQPVHQGYGVVMGKTKEKAPEPEPQPEPEEKKTTRTKTKTRHAGDKTPPRRTTTNQASNTPKKEDESEAKPKSLSTILSELNGISRRASKLGTKGVELSTQASMLSASARGMEIGKLRDQANQLKRKLDALEAAN